MVPGHIYVCGVRDEYLAKLEVSSGFHFGWWFEGEEGLQALDALLNVVGCPEVLS